MDLKKAISLSLLSMQKSEKQTFLILFITSTLVYVSGLFRIDIMDIDASLYAEMSREMLESGDPFIFRNRGLENYLDKPPLVFWLSSLSYMIFGVSHWAYRLPSFLSTLIGVYSTYRFGKLYYGQRSGYIAALILYTCQAWFIVNHDVKTDTLLANFVIFGSWQLAEFFEKRKILNCLLAFAGFGFAMLAKGPIGLMVPLIAFGIHIISKRKWNWIFRWEWLPGIIVLLLVLSPMIYGLYKQYGPYGLEFYFWTQSFGRMTGENHFKDDSDIFFFFHTFAWSFIPWMILNLFASILVIKKLIKTRLQSNGVAELISFGGFILTFLILSKSSFKLPHYILIVFPFAAIYTAGIVDKIISSESISGWYKAARYSQLVITSIIWIAALSLAIFVFPLSNISSWIIALLFLILSIIFLIRKIRISRIVFASAMAIAGANFILNVHFYPNLLRYQSGKPIAEYINSQNITEDRLYQIDVHSSVIDFYGKITPPDINFRKLERLNTSQDTLWVIASEYAYEQINKRNFNIVKTKDFDHFNVQALSLKFLNPATRNDVLEKRYLLGIWGSRQDGKTIGR